ncbi:MAG TPA: alkaline phosphatase family protein [Kofleriaceae bacterium]|nr:alkaline phosphatase family protein [Kofleriaceae bacterium]
MRKLAISTVMMLAACGSSTSGPNGNPDAKGSNAVDADPNAPDADPNAPDAAPGTPDAPTSNAKPTIFTIVLENHDYNEIVSKTSGDAASKNAPYVNSLIKQYGLATAYKDTGHPSLPNYLNLVSGDNQYPGVVDVDPTQFPYFPAKKDNLGDQLTVANIKWRSYQESMGTACKLTGSGKYAPKHDGFLYFDNIQNRGGNQDFCKEHNVDYTEFAADLASNEYRYMWITPNLTDDGHDPSSDPAAALKVSDTWLMNNLPAILDSDGYKAGGIIFLTWDEAEARNGDDADLIPMIVISNRIKTPGMTITTAFTHGSYLATVEDYFGLPRLATVTNAPNLNAFLN